MELGACWINQLTWFDNDENVRKLLTRLGISEKHKVCGSICIGYIDGIKPEKKNIEGKYSDNYKIIGNYIYIDL